MTTIHTFEDLEAWKLARKLTKLIYELTASGDWAKDFGLRDQIRRAAVSSMSNVAEGFERRGDVEFTRYLAIAKASAGEVRSQLYVALDLKYITQQTFNTASELARKTSSVIAALMRYLKGPSPGAAVKQ